MTEATGARAASGRAATFFKLAFGLTVFGITIGGWFGWQFYARSHEPLPNAGGPQGRCVVWFVGSSSIYRWATLAGDMTPWITHNRGVSGAFLPELRRRFANEDVPVPPEAIVFYGGDNDIAKGETAADTAEQFRQFVAAKTAKMPGVPMLVISVKPSPKRWSMRHLQLAYDRAVREVGEHTPGLSLLDASDGLLLDGRPGPYFESDGVHLNAAGYRVWARSVRQALSERLPHSTVSRCATREANAKRGG